MKDTNHTKGGVRKLFLGPVLFILPSFLSRTNNQAKLSHYQRGRPYFYEFVVISSRNMHKRRRRELPPLAPPHPSPPVHRTADGRTLDYSPSSPTTKSQTFTTFLASVPKNRRRERGGALILVVFSIRGPERGGFPPRRMEVRMGQVSATQQKLPTYTVKQLGDDRKFEGFDFQRKYCDDKA